jgi:serine protease Do
MLRQRFSYRAPGLLLLALIVGGGPLTGAVGHGRADELPPLPTVFSKPVPENSTDLLAIEKHVQDVVKLVHPAVVGVRIGQAQGSGVIISKDGYVLTAGHVSGKPDQDVTLLLFDGRKLKGKSLGRNSTIDSGLIQITEKAELPHVAMGKSGDLKAGDWCMAIGHPGGVKPGRTPVVRLGRVLAENKGERGFLRTDCTLVGGDSGGPLFDMHGQVIGIHSRIGGSITANIHVPVDTYRETWERLAKAEDWGAGLFAGKGKFGKGADAYLGAELSYDKAGAKIKTIAPKSPADRAGLKVDDMIVQLDGKAYTTKEDVDGFLRKKRPNEEITLQIQRGTETLTITLKLEKRPG